MSARLPKCAVGAHKINNCRCHCSSDHTTACNRSCSHVLLRRIACFMEALRASFMFKLLLAASHFSICLSRCVGGHVYQVGNVLPPAGGVELQRVVGGLTLKLRCIELCNGIPDCYSMFYNETSADCYLNDHTAFRVSSGGKTNLTYIGWKTRCDETGKVILKLPGIALLVTEYFYICSVH